MANNPLKSLDFFKYNQGGPASGMTSFVITVKFFYTYTPPDAPSEDKKRRGRFKAGPASSVKHL